MAKHNKQRSIERICPSCGQQFITGSSIKTHCSPECGVKCIASTFGDDEKCWEWPGSINPQTGYGQMSRWEDGKRKVYTAHRISFSAHFGKIPDGMQVLHKCDNRPCFNPKHLYVGTQQQNVDDMWNRDRANSALPEVHWTEKYPDKIKRGGDHHLIKNGSSCLKRGVIHYSAKITDDDVRAIRSSAETLLVLSNRFGISQAAVSAVKRKKTWKHVD